jgi:hypothetical protein
MSLSDWAAIVTITCSVGIMVAFPILYVFRTQARDEQYEMKLDVLNERIRDLEKAVGVSPYAVANTPAHYVSSDEEPEPERDPDFWKYWLLNSGANNEARRQVADVAQALGLE